MDKIELIILGGTWTEYPPEYQEKYIRDCFWAANTFYDTKKRDKLSLIEEQNINEDDMKGMSQVWTQETHESRRWYD